MYKVRLRNMYWGERPEYHVVSPNGVTIAIASTKYSAHKIINALNQTLKGV